ncbi:MAG: NAD(+)/NADH kinase [Chloroflexota bacterium]
MKRIGILHHPKLPQSQSLAQEIAAWLAMHGVSPWQASAWDEALVEGEIGSLDLLITLGGDGTILRAARMGACHGVPILGLNLGRLGFLAELQPGDWQAPMGRLLEGDYWIEQRMMLHAEFLHNGECRRAFEALNDVVVSRGSLARIVRLTASVDGGYLATYAADGLIIATATGSTAYALAVGGPILPPQLHNILVIPIAPHLSLERAVVLAEGSTVSVAVSTDHTAMLTIDGQFEVELQHEDTVIVKASPYRACFVRMQESTYFYRTLMARLRPAGYE